MKNKKVTFLIIFCLLIFGAKSQSVDNQRKGAGKEYYVEITTDYGNMVVKLYNETPQHRDNFIKLVKEGFYDGLLFHRVINHFMIQGGDPESRNAAPNQMLGNGTLGYRVPAEFVPGLIHKKGVLAAARDNNPEKASSSCQFYLVQGNVWPGDRLQMMAQQMGKTLTKQQIDTYTTVGGTPHLDGDYTVFGEVVEGVEVIDKIAAVPCGPMDRPVKDVKMSMKIIER